MNNLQSKAKKDRLVEILNKHKLSQDFYNNTQSYEVSFSYIMREYIDNLYGEDNLELPLFLKRSDFKDDYSL